jgi:hypothetical protein
METVDPSARDRSRVRVFIDYWNFQLGINERAAQEQGEEEVRFRLDWRRIGPVLARHACSTVGLTESEYVFDGANVYTSYDPNTQAGRGYLNWVSNWLNRQPGIHVDCRERRPRRPPKCPSCYREITSCPHDDCGQPLKGTIEKGVDTLIATDMIRLAWEEAYDIAVLASSDADLVPAVEFLNVRARKVVQTGFPPKGIHLATTCWASFDAWDCHRDLQREG